MANDIDLAQTDDGDIITDGGKVQLSGGSNNISTLRWQIIHRLKTPLGQDPVYPEYGSNLHLIRGLPNTAETGQVIEDEIIRCLTYDALITENNLDVRAVPINNNKLLVRIDVSLENQNILTINIPLSLSDGLIL